MKTNKQLKELIEEIETYGRLCKNPDLKQEELCQKDRLIETYKEVVEKVLGKIGLDHKEVNADIQGTNELLYRNTWNTARDEIEKQKEKLRKQYGK